MSYIGCIECVEIDLSLPALGISKDVYANLCCKINGLIHCASNTSFSEQKREMVFNSNVHSLKNVLTLAENAHVDFFHYISTAYVGETGGKPCKEVLV